MQTIKPKPAVPAPTAKSWLHGNRAPYFAISAREYLSLGRFSNAADPLGVETIDIRRGPFEVGCLLKLSSGNHDYEVLVSDGRILLGKVEASGKRIRLFEGGTNTEIQWVMLLQALKHSEGRL